MGTEESSAISNRLHKYGLLIIVVGIYCSVIIDAIPNPDVSNRQVWGW